MKESICEEIRSLKNLIHRKLVGDESSSTINNAGGFIIGYLINQGDKVVYQKDLEKIFSLRRSSITSSIKLLEKDGMVVRLNDDKDSRKKIIVVTDKARECHKKFISKIENIENEIKNCLTKEEIEQFLSYIEKIKEGLK